MLRQIVKTITHRIPPIGRLVRQRDELLQEVERLQRNMTDGHPTGQMNALAERHYGSDGNRKPLIYLMEYERLFGPMRDAPVRLLELGVKFGASMHLWADYFPNATIVGLDIGNKPKDFPADKRVHFVQGNQDDPSALARCIKVAGGEFNIIVDDAFHVGRLSASSFSYLFPRALKPGGFYVIEDICTAFLPKFPVSETFAATDGDKTADAAGDPAKEIDRLGCVGRRERVVA
jgi:hypothetical protein